MKILLINWQDPANPQAGGAEIHLVEVFSRLVASGHEVTWLCSGWPGSAQTDDTAGIQLRRTGSRYTFGIASPLYFRRHLDRQPFDVVVEALNKVPVYAPLWAGRPVVLLVHHLFGTTAFQEASWPIAALTWLQERPLARVYRDSPVQAISESTKVDLVTRGFSGDSIEVIHPGVDLQFFTPDPSLSRAADPTFLYLGRLRKYKRVDLTIGALARLRSSGVPARLVIAGKGADEPRLRELTQQLGMEQHVDFAGYVTEEDKRRLFRTVWANLFVSPKEGWGITNLEAAACGTPTIASDSPGLRESVMDGRTGLLVPYGDEQALAEAMLTLSTQRELVNRLGAGALDFARQFTWSRASDSTERHLLQSVARSQNGRRY